MELRLHVPTSLPKISTIVRAYNSMLGLALHRLAFRLLAILAPQWAVTRARRMFLTPPRYAFSEAELSALEEATLVTVPLLTGKLVAWRWVPRNAPLVVLVHGWGGRGAQLRGFVDPLLARGFAVMTYDAPGHGMTGGHVSSVVHLTQALESVLAETGPVAAVIGHSLGGAAAARVLTRGTHAQAAVLIAPPASLTWHSRNFAKLLGISEPLRYQMQRQIERHFGIEWKEFEADSALPRCPCPLLVVHDEDDRENAFQDAQRYARHWPGARLMRTEGLGHRRILHDKVTIARIADFVSHNTQP
ncbi:MAG: alpha/beta hydrolase [Proteobacteria bacterium]|nr:alpha/beta hydrolase [Pseudomonadota bacterium]